MKFLIRHTKELVHEALKTSMLLFKIMIPVSIIIKILKETGLIEIIGKAFGPLMVLIGLPGEMGIVWVTGMVTNLYGGILAFVSISQSVPLTAAQATVIATMMLVAHSLPVELEVARRAGVRLWVIFLVRIFGALILGALLNAGYTLSGVLSQSSAVVWSGKPVEQQTLSIWALGEVKNYCMIFLVILLLLLLMKILKKIGVIAWMEWLFAPLLQKIGIGSSVTPLTIVGMTLGISYGGALIIREAQSGHLKKRDIFFAMVLLGLCHSFIEDTLLMASLGGHWSGLLLGRTLFAVFAVYLFVRITQPLDDVTFAGRFLNKHAV